MFDKPFIPMDSDPFIPGKPLHSTAELDELKRKYELSSPSQQSGPRKQVADVNNDEAPAPVATKPAPLAKPESVAAPEKKIGAMFTRVKKEKSKS